MCLGIFIHSQTQFQYLKISKFRFQYEYTYFQYKNSIQRFFLFILYSRLSVNYYCLRSIYSYYLKSTNTYYICICISFSFYFKEVSLHLHDGFIRFILFFLFLLFSYGNSWLKIAYLVIQIYVQLYSYQLITIIESSQSSQSVKT